MNRKLEVLIFVLIAISVMVVMFFTMACSPLLPWVQSIGGNCSIQICPSFMGCIK